MTSSKDQSADRPARIVIEVPPGAAPPRAVEMALAGGERRRIALAVPTPISLSTIATGIATVIGNALASIRTIVTTLSSRWDAADANTAKTYAPMTYFDGYLPRHLRRRTIHGTRKVERVVIDEWMMWRM